MITPVFSPPTAYVSLVECITKLTLKVSLFRQRRAWCDAAHPSRPVRCPLARPGVRPQFDAERARLDYSFREARLQTLLGKPDMHSSPNRRWRKRHPRPRSAIDDALGGPAHGMWLMDRPCQRSLRHARLCNPTPSLSCAGMGQQGLRYDPAHVAHPIRQKMETHGQRPLRNHL